MRSSLGPSGRQDQRQLPVPVEASRPLRPRPPAVRFHWTVVPDTLVATFLVPSLIYAWRFFGWRISLPTLLLIAVLSWWIWMRAWVFLEKRPWPHERLSEWLSFKFLISSFFGVIWITLLTASGSLDRATQGATPLPEWHLPGWAVLCLVGPLSIRAVQVTLPLVRPRRPGVLPPSSGLKLIEEPRALGGGPPSPLPHGACCPYCGMEFLGTEEVSLCPRCETPHHSDCWREARVCTTYGCGQATRDW